MALGPLRIVQTEGSIDTLPYCQEQMLVTGESIFVEHTDRVSPPSVEVRAKGSDIVLYTIQPRLDDTSNVWFMSVCVGEKYFLLSVKPDSNSKDAWGMSRADSTNRLFARNRQLVNNPFPSVIYFIREFGARRPSSVGPYYRETVPHTVVLGGSRLNQPDRHGKVYCDICALVAVECGLEVSNLDFPMVSFGLTTARVGNREVPGFRISVAGRDGGTFDTAAILSNFSLNHG